MMIGTHCDSPKKNTSVVEISTAQHLPFSDITTNVPKKPTSPSTSPSRLEDIQKNEAEPKYLLANKVEKSNQKKCK